VGVVPLRLSGDFVVVRNRRQPRGAERAEAEELPAIEPASVGRFRSGVGAATRRKGLHAPSVGRAGRRPRAGPRTIPA